MVINYRCIYEGETCLIHEIWIGNLALSRALGDFDFKKALHLPPEQQAVTGRCSLYISINNIN